MSERLGTVVFKNISLPYNFIGAGECTDLRHPCTISVFLLKPHHMQISKNGTEVSRNESLYSIVLHVPTNVLDQTVVNRV